MKENRKTCRIARMKHVFALIYVESLSRKTCQEYLERRANHYTAQMHLLPAYVADLRQVISK